MSIQFPNRPLPPKKQTAQTFLAYFRALDREIEPWAGAIYLASELDPTTNNPTPESAEHEDDICSFSLQEQIQTHPQPYNFAHPSLSLSFSSFSSWEVHLPISLPTSTNSASPSPITTPSESSTVPLTKIFFPSTRSTRPLTSTTCGNLTGRLKLIFSDAVAFEERPRLGLTNRLVWAPEITEVSDAGANGVGRVEGFADEDGFGGGEGRAVGGGGVEDVFLGEEGVAPGDGVEVG
ncbi:hypothetical protein M7I_5961 [Glarea lozoyensis 74030]|uniref:Uncharacterized protein n=1 Tax=Glarea lozoyensis (strain ATCC 74030 / MF5533) TaxID=1104152 RepID=H0ETA2_GLAL7|nr:hypothetical protein M7I_5961 [Glarea lozoyensis 74030]